MTLKNGFGKCSLFVFSVNGRKDQIWTLRFPAKENPNMEKALFDWPIVLQYDVKAKYRLISRQSSGMKFFNQPKATPVCIRSINQSNRSICVVVCCFCFVREFSFQGHTKIALRVNRPKLPSERSLNCIA